MDQIQNFIVLINEIDTNISCTMTVELSQNDSMIVEDSQHINMYQAIVIDNLKFPQNNNSADGINLLRKDIDVQQKHLPSFNSDEILLLKCTIDELKLKIKDLDKNVLTHSEELSIKNNENANVKQELLVTKKEYYLLKSKYEKLVNDHDCSKMIIKNLEKDYESLNNEIRSSKQKYDSLITDYRLLAYECNKLQMLKNNFSESKKCDEMTLQNIALKKTIDDMNRKSYLEKKKYEVVKKSLDDLKIEHGNLTIECKTEREKNNFMMNKIHELNDEFDDKRETYENKIRALMYYGNETEIYCDEYERALFEMEGHYNNLLNENNVLNNKVNQLLGKKGMFNEHVSRNNIGVINSVREKNKISNTDWRTSVNKGGNRLKSTVNKKVDKWGRSGTFDIDYRDPYVKKEKL